MKVKITIEEHISKTMEIDADSIEDAIEIAEDYYHNGEFAEDTLGIPTATLMMAESDDECTEWIEF